MSKNIKINNGNNNQKDIVDRSLGKLPIGMLLFRMSFPMMISMLMLACYNIVDSIFVSRVSEDALSALSLAAPVQFLMSALIIGTNIGVTANISRSLGERKFDHANDYARHSIVIAFIYGIIFIFFGVFLTEKYFTMQTQNAEIIRHGVDYLSINSIFTFGVFLQICFEKMMQATGKSVGSMITQISGAIVNIVLDPILIFGFFGFPAMGAKGAAIATVLGQFFGAFIGFILHNKINSEINISLKGFTFKKHILSNIFRIGLPSIIMQALSSFMIFGLNTILITYSSAVAVLGIYYKVQSFIFMPVFGLNNGLVPIVSYNFGSHNKERLMRVVKYACFAAISITIVGASIFSIFSKNIFMLFDANPYMLEVGVYAFSIIAFHFPIAGFNIMLDSTMQATKKELYTLFISIVRQVVVLLPSAYLLSKYFGLRGIWFAFPLSEIVALLLNIYLFKRTYDEQIATL